MQEITVIQLHTSRLLLDVKNNRNNLFLFLSLVLIEHIILEDVDCAPRLIFIKVNTAIIIIHYTSTAAQTTRPKTFRQTVNIKGFVVCLPLIPVVSNSEPAVI